MAFFNDDKNDALKCTKAVLMDVWAPSQTLINTLQTHQKAASPARGGSLPPVLAFSYLLFLSQKSEDAPKVANYNGFSSLPGNWSLTAQKNLLREQLLLTVSKKQFRGDS